jgi:hypothetical protein
VLRGVKNTLDSPGPAEPRAVPAAMVSEHLPHRMLWRQPTWGDTSVSSCRSYNRATGPGTSAGAFPTARFLSGEDARGPRRGAKGSCGTPLS